MKVHGIEGTLSLLFSLEKRERKFQYLKMICNSGGFQPIKRKSYSSLACVAAWKNLGCNVCEAASRSCVVLPAPQRTQRITGSVFPISFHPDCQIHNLNGFFNGQIMVRTHILVLRSGPRTRISALFRLRT